MLDAGKLLREVGTRVLAGFWRLLSFYFGFDCKLPALDSIEASGCHETATCTINRRNAYGYLTGWEIFFFLVFGFKLLWQSHPKKFFLVEPWRKLIPAMVKTVTHQNGVRKSSWDDLCTCNVIFLSGGGKKSVVHVSWTVDQRGTTLQS